MAEKITFRPNHLLRRQRRPRGWMLVDVAEGLHRVAGDLPEVGLDAHMVGRWERGVRRPPTYVRLPTLLFELPADALGLVEDVPEIGGNIAFVAFTTWSVTTTVAGCTEHCWIELPPPFIRHLI